MKKLRYWIILLLSLCLIGCSRSEQEPESTATSTLAPGSYRVYYLDQSGYRLQNEVISLEATDPVALSDALLKCMTKPLQSRLISVLPARMKVLSVHYDVDQKLLQLDVSGEYNDQSSTREILCRAALVWTLTQIEGVDYVQITVDNMPLKDALGNQIGILQASDFDAEIGGGTRYTTLILYFTDETGTMLVEEEREVSYLNEVSLERIIVEEIIKGPQSDGAYPVLLPDLKLKDITVRDGVCYVYFDGAFLKNTLLVKDVIPVYAIVNSLAELSDITKVQFVIDNAYDATFRETLSLAAPFERNLDLIQEKE